jgi:hypothetical protein
MDGLPKIDSFRVLHRCSKKANWKDESWNIPVITIVVFTGMPSGNSNSAIGQYSEGASTLNPIIPVIPVFAEWLIAQHEYSAGCL